ncbi:hypothetical protein XA68_10557 [Ophiocordyceps unilateralis]|uniref:Uncharacterized protein n=1 Tax=Ophiocordyceps unilateralis TaxID=268505 RepID=A0A2A9P2G3_OPHUN|nr:hypothetical protein XA68_10557 [Ophiocordyceps unilateralis]
MRQLLHPASMALLLALYFAHWTGTCDAAPQMYGIGSGRSKGIHVGIGSYGARSRNPGFKAGALSPGDHGRTLGSPRGRVLPPGAPGNRNIKPGPPVDRSRKAFFTGRYSSKLSPAFLLPDPNLAASTRMPTMQASRSLDWPVKQGAGRFQMPEKQHFDSLKPVKQPQAAAAVPVKQSSRKMSAEKAEAASAGKVSTAQQKTAQRERLPPKESRELEAANGETYWTVKRLGQPLSEADIRPKQLAKQVARPPLKVKNFNTANRGPKESTQFQIENGDIYSTVKRFGQPLHEANFRRKDAARQAFRSPGTRKGQEAANTHRSPPQRGRTQQPRGADAESALSPSLPSVVNEKQPVPDKTYSLLGIVGQPLTKSDREFLSPKRKGKENSKPTVRQIDKAMSYVPVDLSKVDNAAANKDDRTTFIKSAGSRIGGLFQKGRVSSGEKHSRKELETVQRLDEARQNSPSPPAEGRKSRFESFRDAVRQRFRRVSRGRRPRKNKEKAEKEAEGDNQDQVAEHGIGMTARDDDSVAPVRLSRWPTTRIRKSIPIDE